MIKEDASLYPPHSLWEGQNMVEALPVRTDAPIFGATRWGAIVTAHFAVIAVVTLPVRAAEAVVQEMPVIPLMAKCVEVDNAMTQSCTHILALRPVNMVGVPLSALHLFMTDFALHGSPQSVLLVASPADHVDHAQRVVLVVAVRTRREHELVATLDNKMRLRK